jgi:hypothetical protein
LNGKTKRLKHCCQNRIYVTDNKVIVSVCNNHSPVEGVRVPKGFHAWDTSLESVLFCLWLLIWYLVVELKESRSLVSRQVKGKPLVTHSSDAYFVDI